MTVNELIEHLKKYDGRLKVFIFDWNEEYAPHTELKHDWIIIDEEYQHEYEERMKNEPL